MNNSTGISQHVTSPLLFTEHEEERAELNTMDKKPAEKLQMSIILIIQMEYVMCNFKHGSSIKVWSTWIFFKTSYNFGNVC